MEKKIVIQVQEAERVPGGMNPRKNTPRQRNQTDKNKDKDKILKTTKEKQHITYKGTPIRLSADFLTDRREWHDIFKMMKGKNLLI